MSQQFLLKIAARFIPAPIAVADQAGRVGDQDQALRVIENFAGKVALALQL